MCRHPEIRLHIYLSPHFQPPAFFCALSSLDSSKAGIALLLLPLPFTRKRLQPVLGNATCAHASLVLLVGALQCTALCWFFAVLPRAHWFSAHHWLFLSKNFEVFIGGYLAFHPSPPSTHTGADSHIYLPGQWNLRSYYCPLPHAHLPFFSWKSSLFLAVTAQRWGTHSCLPLCHHQQLISSTVGMSECRDLTQTPAMTATASFRGITNDN